MKLIAPGCAHSFLISVSFLSTVIQNPVLGSSRCTVRYVMRQTNHLGGAMTKALPRMPSEQQVLHGR